MKRRLIAMLLAGAMVLSMAACGQDGGKDSQSAGSSGSSQQSTPSSGTGTSQGGSSAPVVQPEAAYKEAPALASLVQAGTLPKLEDRLPAEDDIYVEQVDATGKTLEIGTYGGVINLGAAGGSWGLVRPVLEGIIRYNADGSYYPNVIKSYEHSEDYKVWTFKLREGMKWSDGDDFNADDITFWYYMCHLNNYDTKKSWTALKDGEETWAKLEKVDDYTVTWTFENPKYPADFIENGDFKWCWAPSHYLADLIPDSFYIENDYWKKTGLDDETVLKNAKAKGITTETVKDLGKMIAYYWWNEEGIPCLSSYVLSTKPGNSSKDDPLCILERNPYFWKVDAKGQQLPYCDEIRFNKLGDGQDQLEFRSGNIDYIEVQMQDVASIRKDLGDKAQLRVLSSSNWGTCLITFNYTCKDENYAKLFSDIRFREAISICVDRTTVSGLLSDGFLEPAQCAPAEGNFGYDAEWAKKWTEYDVAKAKKLLEECGLKMGADGFYDFADGSDFILTIYTYTTDSSGTTSNDYAVLEQYYRAAGIKCATKEYEVTAFDQEIDNNDWYAVLGPHTAIGGLSMRSRVEPFVPIKQAAEWYGEYGTYRETNGDKGVKPEGDMAKLVEIYDQWKDTPDSAKRDEYNLDIYKIHKDNLWTIAYLEAVGTYTLVSSKIQNYPEGLVSDDLYQYQNIVHYWTLFKTE